jgi:hypothetical protein
VRWRPGRGRYWVTLAQPGSVDVVVDRTHELPVDDHARHGFTHLGLGREPPGELGVASATRAWSPGSGVEASPCHLDPP